MTVTFLKSNREIESFAQNIPHIVKAGLDSDISNERKLFLKWCIGLTEKGIQNVLRGKGGEFENYLDVLQQSIEEAARKCNMDYGSLDGVLKIRGEESRVNWPFVLYLFTAIGAQTLAIRGSESASRAESPKWRRRLTATSFR